MLPNALLYHMADYSHNIPSTANFNIIASVILYGWLFTSQNWNCIQFKNGHKIKKVSYV